MALKTEYAREKEKRDKDIYREWMRLTADPRNSRTLISERLMAKHEIYAKSTFYRIIKEQTAIQQR